MFVQQIIYRMSQEEHTKLREGVPYVKLYRYNPKHLCPKLNGYWDNGQIKCGLPSGPRTIAVSWFALSVICSPVHHTNCWRSPEMHIPAYVRQADRQAGWRHRSAFQCDVLRTLCIITWVRGTLHFKLMALCHSQVTLMLSTDINITETTYSCQFQYEFGNQ